MITIVVNNVESKLSECPSELIVEEIRKELRYKNDADNPFMKQKFQRFNYEIPEFKYLYHKGKKTFPTGLLDKVEKIFQDNKVDYKVDDQRIDYPPINPLPIKGYKLRKYQMDAKKTALDNKNCTIRIATGGGKTAIMAALAGELNGYKQIIFVRRQMLLMQTIRVYERELGIEIGQIGVGVVNIKDITVAMIPTVARAIDSKWKFKKSNDDDEDDDTKLTKNQQENIQNYLKNCECLTIDESHCLGSETAQLVANYATKARYRWSFSATPWRDDGKDILLDAATGPRVVNIDASYLIERDFLVPPHIFFFKTPSVRIPVHIQGKYQDVYKEFIVENQSRNQVIIDKAIEAYNRFEKILILVQQIDHGKIILEALEKEGIWTEYISGSRTMISREELVKTFQTRSRSVLIGTNGTLAEGIDIPEISVLINASGGKSSVQFYQKIGRAIRIAEDKKRAIVIDFLDQNIKYMQNHAKARIKLIKTESLYKLKVQE